MTDLADVDRFKICIQDCVLSGFWPLTYEHDTYQRDTQDGHESPRFSVMGWQNRLKFIGKTNQLKISLQNVYFNCFGQFRVILWYLW